jgi:hypothetical protein
MTRRLRRMLLSGAAALAAAVSAALLSGCGADGLPDASSSALRVETVPDRAEVFVDGRSYGRAPVTIENLAPGRHLMEARREGFRDAFREVSLLKGQRLTEELQLEAVRGLVLIESDPPGADVVIDEVFRGRTPLMLHDLPLGPHRLSVRKDQYFPRQIGFAVDRRRPERVSVRLASDAAALDIRSDPAGGRVALDGATVGETPCRVENVRTGDLTLEIAREGFVPFQKRLRLRAGDEIQVDAELVPLPGGLTIYSVPEDARVILDGTDRGRTPVTFSNLAVAVHRVRVEKEGYESQTRDLSLAPGARRIEEFRLNRDSGTLVLITDPPGARVSIDGEFRGETRGRAGEPLSEPLQIDHVKAGERTVQITRRGYQTRSFRVSVGIDDVVSRHESLRRLFIPDTAVRTGSRAQDVFTGILIRRHEDGAVELETRPGIILRIEAEDVVDVRSLEME